jgi:hypothetical protein
VKARPLFYFLAKEHLTINVFAPFCYYQVGLTLFNGAIGELDSVIIPVP